MEHFKVATKQVVGQFMHISEQCSEHWRTVAPARRADFCDITGNKTFPLEFCQVRWVENVTVAQRALELLPDICQYVSKTKRLPGTVTCENWSHCAPSVCEPLVLWSTKPQNQWHRSCMTTRNICCQLMKRFVKKSLIKEADSVAKVSKIDVSCKDSWFSYKEVDVGVAATKALSTVSAFYLILSDSTIGWV